MNERKGTLLEEKIIGLLASVPKQLFIGGQWVDSSTGNTLNVRNPASNQVLVSIADADERDAQQAMDAAAAVQEEWANVSPREKSDLLRRVYDLVIDRKEEFATIITLEMGKPIGESRAEVQYAADYIRWFSEEALRISGRYATNPAGTGKILVSHRPVGISYLITPWNFPMAMATRKIAPALAAGCTVVIKPAELTPLTTLYFAEVLREAGLPVGVVNVLTTSQSRKLSAPIFSDSRLRKLSFTGSTEVGVALLKQSADKVLRASMELGGNAPFIVFEDADLDAAVEGALAAKFRNIGQACTAGNRFLIHSSVAEEFSRRVVEKVKAMKVGQGISPDISIGPLINEAAVSDMVELLADAEKYGSEILTGGNTIESDGYFMEPTVITNVAEDSRLFQEEIFGPIFGIKTFETEEEAVRLANATQFGLISFVYTRDLARAHRLIDSLETGMTGVNTGVVSDATAPFGGIKQSGLGREGGFEGIYEYLDTKYTLIKDS